MMMLVGPRHCPAFTCALRGAHDSDCATGVARSDEGCFSWDRESVDSWTLGLKPLCHRHPTGPHPSGLPWTPAKGDSTKSDFALRDQRLPAVELVALLDAERRHVVDAAQFGDRLV